MITEEFWEELENGTTGLDGTVRRRLLAVGQHDVFLAVRVPAGERLIIFECDSIPDQLKMKSTALVEPEIVRRRSPLRCEVQFRLLSQNGAPVFTAFCNDLMNELQKFNEASVGLIKVINRYDLWRRLFGPAMDSGLSLAQQQGLFGELEVLRQLISGLGGIVALETWRGPLHDSIDFSSDGKGVEVKTIASLHPLVVRISSERQLSSQGLQRLILHVIEVAIRYEGLGNSLNRQVDEIRSLLKGDEVFQFVDRLTSAGYLDLHRERYEQPRYSLLNTHYFEVSKGFPRLVIDDIPKGVGSVSYDLSLDACVQYQVKMDTISDLWLH